MIKISPFDHRYQQSEPHAFTICGICCVFASHLDLDKKLLATAFMSSCLNYCNSPLYGIADMDLIRLQACTESTDPPGDKVSSIYLQSCTASFPSLVATIYLSIYPIVLGTVGAPLCGESWAMSHGGAHPSPCQTTAKILQLGGLPWSRVLD